MKTADLEAALGAGVVQQTRVRAYRGAHLITSPFTLSNGAPLEFRAVIDGSDVMLTDDGMTAQCLGDLGIDISAKTMSHHWVSIRRSLPFAPALGSEDWELALTAPVAKLGAAVVALSEAAVQGDSLRILAPSFRPVTMKQRIIRNVVAREPRVTIAQRAEMGMDAGGHRQVSFSAALTRTAYVQTVGRSQGPHEAYDKALGTFTHSAISYGQRLVIFDGALRDMPSWQRTGIEKVAYLVSGRDEDAAAEAVLERTA